jgi:hypothetical protein
LNLLAISVTTTFLIVVVSKPCKLRSYGVNDIASTSTTRAVRIVGVGICCDASGMIFLSFWNVGYISETTAPCGVPIAWVSMSSPFIFLNTFEVPSVTTSLADVASSTSTGREARLARARAAIVSSRRLASHVAKSATARGVDSQFLAFPDSVDDLLLMSKGSLFGDRVSGWGSHVACSSTARMGGNVLSAGRELAASLIAILLTFDAVSRNTVGSSEVAGTATANGCKVHLPTTRWRSFGLVIVRILPFWTEHPAYRLADPLEGARWRNA